MSIVDEIAMPDQPGNDNFETGYRFIVIPLSEVLVMLRLLLVMLSLVVIAGGCAIRPNTVTAAKQPLTMQQHLIWIKMLGRWYGGEYTTDGGYREQITVRYADGTYRHHFRSYSADGIVQDSIEVGRWGVSGNIYFTFFAGWVKNGEFQQADPGNPYNYDAYIIDFLNDKEMQYHSVPHDNHYTIKRVLGNFDMLGPPPGFIEE